MSRGGKHPAMDPKYRRMVKILAEREKSSRKKRGKEPWFLYILRCADQTLYTGITKDLERRVRMHNDGTGCRYTRFRRPVEMIYHEKCANRSRALIRELEIKTLPKNKKEELIHG